MTKPTDICIIDSKSWAEYFPYRSPAKFGGRVVTDVVLLNVEVRVRNRKGEEAIGRGSMSMGNIWAWPSKTLSTEQTLEIMTAFGEKVASAAIDTSTWGHPLELTYDYAKKYDMFAETITKSRQVESMGKLAQLVAASPFEAAVFDAFGRIMNENVYQLLSEKYCSRDLSYYLGDEFRGEYLDQYTLRKPKARMPIYHLVGALDPLDKGDVSSPVGDGLPETLAEWIPYNGLTHLKIKLNGDDIDWDVERVCRIDRIAETIQLQRGVRHWFYSADFNEKCQHVNYVLEFLERIQKQRPNVMERLQYIEQPTHRHLRDFPENRMHEAAKIKPVVIDESLVDFQALLDSREMGYSGVALKACKGHAEALLMGAAAQKYKMFLCVQDLTCPGASFLHSATLSAHIPTVAAIEGNGRQYCPLANTEWEKKYPGMFQIHDGTVETALLSEVGLGFSWNDNDSIVTS
ncbi:MAG: enolase C-terminal domain-like protein [Thermoguttaceae bacterium]